VVVVVAAGEQHPGQDFQDKWPLCNHVISVTATDNFDNSAHYADWTGTNDLAAPGGDSPSLGVHGGHALTLPVASTYLNNAFVGGIGTSYAAPHVSGCAALMKTLDPTFSADFIELKMEESALDLINSGYVPNNATAGKDKVFGWGLLKCDAALLTTAPKISFVVPGNSTSVNQFNVSYSLNEVVSLGTITFTGTSGTDLGVVHTYNFAVWDKAAGPHIISKTNLETGFASPLVSGSGYTMTISVTDAAASSMSISVSKTLITYTNPPGICPTPTVPWVIESGCKIVSQVNPSGNVDVQNGAIVTIDPTGTLNIDSLTKHLKIHYGSGIIIKSGGKIN
jgi:subtilisin family serine protease